MLVKITSLEETKNLFVQMLLNKTDKVSKITDESVLNGIAYGVAKVNQKISKDSALIEASLFPTRASGDVLDEVARMRGISSRFTSRGSSTYIRIVANPNTLYQANLVSFSNTAGITFELTSNITIGPLGYAYVLVRSVDVGSVTNVEALTINRINNQPTGHLYVINEYKAEGGVDNENDDEFRERIINNNNYLASQTLQKLTQVAINSDERVLKLVNLGRDNNSKSKIGVVPKNGIDFTTIELENILLQISPFLSIKDISTNETGDIYGVSLVNIGYIYIDIDMRVDLYDSSQADSTRKNIQTDVSKLIDYRFWKPGQKVEWDDLLRVVKDNSNVKYVYDSYFQPHNDIIIDKNKFPRMRSFIMRDSSGNVMVDKSGYINPLYFPNSTNYTFINLIT